MHAVIWANVRMAEEQSKQYSIIKNCSKLFLLQIYKCIILQIQVCKYFISGKTKKTAMDSDVSN